MTAPAPAEWLLGVWVADGCAPSAAHALLEGCAALQRVSRVGLVVESGRAAPQWLRDAAAFTRRAEWGDVAAEATLEGARVPSERRLALVDARHGLGADAVDAFLAHHEASGERATVFAPGLHATWHTPPIARAWEAQAAAWTPGRARRLVAERVGRVLGAVKRDAAGALSPGLRRAGRRAWARLGGVGARLRGARGDAAGAGPYLGRPEDQVELLAEQAPARFPFPQIVNLVLTNLCNLKCVMCPYHSPHYPDQSGYFAAKRYMSVEVFERVAREAGRHGASLKLGQLEEVFVHPELVPWIARARELGVPEVHVTTNGTLLNQQRADALVQAGVTRVYVSLDAATAETYQKIRGWNFEKVVRHTRGLLDARDRLNPDLRVYTTMILQGDAVAERDAFVAQWREYGADGVVVYQLSEHHGGDNTIVGQYFEPTPPTARHACSSVFEECYVYPEGEVSMCCTTMILVPQTGLISLGNVLERPLADVWLGAGYSDLRRRLLRNEVADLPACRDCQIWQASETRDVVTADYTLRMNPTCAIYSFH